MFFTVTQSLSVYLRVSASSRPTLSNAHNTLSLSLSFSHSFSRSDSVSLSFSPSLSLHLSTSLTLFLTFSFSNSLYLSLSFSLYLSLSLQTWFGAQPWKSYGIQMMPLTPASELRDDPQWVEEMLPSFEESCYNDKGVLCCLISHQFNDPSPSIYLSIALSLTPSLIRTHTLSFHSKFLSNYLRSNRSIIFPLCKVTTTFPYCKVTTTIYRISHPVLCCTMLVIINTYFT